MEPSKKTPEMEKALKDFTGVDRRKAIRNMECAFDCDNPNLNFRDQLSKKEYTISGLCQNCQDIVFGK